MALIVEAVEADLLSRDATRIHAALWEIVRCDDRGVLAALAAEVLPMRERIADVPLGGGLIPNARLREIAFRRLELSRSEACFCTLYPAEWFRDPAKEAEAGRVAILAVAHDRQAWTSRHECRCLICGCAYRVAGQAGWHVPTWEWVPL